jgi:hypothetical protein
VVDGGLTVLVVDGEEHSRTHLLLALRRLGVRALGVDGVTNAAALLGGLEPDIVLVVGEAESAVAPLRMRSAVLSVGREGGLDEAVVSLLRLLGRPEAAAALN